MSLVEVLIAIALAAVLLSLAVPMTKSLQARRATDAALSTLASDFSLARSEAIRRGHFVIICPSDDGQSCSTENDWREGWLMLEKIPATNPAQTFVLRAQGPLPGIASLVVTLGAAQDEFTFGPTGVGVATGGNVRLKPAADPSAERLLCISAAGVQELRDPGTQSC